jgi:hypothetical protein
MTSGTDPCPEREDRRAACHGLDHHQAERLRPVDREQQGTGIAEERGLIPLVDFPDIFNPRLVEHRLDDFAEIIFVRLVDLGRDLQGNTFCKPILTMNRCRATCDLTVFNCLSRSV